MSQSNLQILLHAGELSYIVEAIKRSQGGFVGGCLFGLWRNSLKQPVIQFVTGPSKNFGEKSSVDDLLNDKYNEKCRGILFENHAMLKLGYWFAGSPQEKNKAHDNFVSSRHNLLLFIDLSGGLGGEFFLIKGENQDHGSLCREDVLSGNSSFRIYKPLINLIDPGAKYRSQLGDRELEYLSSHIENLPSRIEVRDPETKETQWYSTDKGAEALQLLFQYFNKESIQVEMSRDTSTHNIQFNLTGGYCLDFPENFPKKLPTLSDAGGNDVVVSYQRGNDVCRDVVNAVISCLQRRRGYRGY